MGDYSEDLIVAKRNIHALHVAVEQLHGRRSEDTSRVESLMATVTQLSQQVQNLTQAVAVLRASGLGRGPTA